MLRDSGTSSTEKLETGSNSQPLGSQPNAVSHPNDSDSDYDDSDNVNDNDKA